MPAEMMTVVQCGDDGLGIPATFNLCAGLHEDQPRFGWIHGGNEVWRLG